MRLYKYLSHLVELLIIVYTGILVTYGDPFTGKVVGEHYELYFATTVSIIFLAWLQHRVKLAGSSAPAQLSAKRERDVFLASVCILIALVFLRGVRRM